MPDSSGPLLSMSMAELALALGSEARARAVRRWLCGTWPLPRVLPERLPGVAAKAWAELRAQCRWELPGVGRRQVSSDGTIKYALEVEGGAVECVLIPGRGRSTVCLSSQVGCTRRCRFCATARLGFVRNLRAEEIVAQYLVARAEAPPEAPARNVVFMGMGEPMDNLDEVLAALGWLCESPAPQLSPAHVTVSTSGVLPGMQRFLRSSRANLALSLNATSDAERERLMPQTKTWPLAELLKGIAEGVGSEPGRLCFLEYVLWDGVNDRDEDAERLLGILARVPARLNLIAHNSFPGCELRPSPKERVAAFHERLVQGGARCMVRASRGADIAAACGQLALVPLPAR